MVLTVKNIIQKAKKKGIAPNEITPLPNNLLIKPWQQESVLFNNENDKEKETGHKLNTNRTQTRHKLDTNRTQTEHKENIQNIKTGHKLDTKVDTTGDTNWTQTGHKLDTKSTFKTLVGLQQKVLFLLFEICKKTRSKTTEPITLEYISIHLNIRLGSIKTTIRRLQEKNLVKRIEYKNGRSGWSKYELPDAIFNEILQFETGHKLDTNWTQTEHKLDTKADTKVDTSLSSSSSNNINNINNKTTTTGDNENFETPALPLSTEWIEIDIEPLNTIGFTQTHLVQIASQNKLQPKVVQDSIYAFAFDLEKNDRAKTIKGDPINFFMGILRNGKPYAPASNYESPQDEAMRLYLARMREIEQKRAVEEKEAFDLAFKDWFSKLSAEQKRNFLPEILRRTANLETNRTLEDFARSHFEKEIWALNKAKIIVED